MFRRSKSGSPAGAVAARPFRTTVDTLRRRALVASPIFVASVVLLTAGPASAASSCQGTAFRSTPAVNAPFQVDPGAPDRSMPGIRSGQTVDELTLYVVGTHGRGNAYCVRGGPCYPATAIEVSNCTIGAAESSDATMHPLDIIRSKFSSMQLVRHDVDDELVTIGLSNAAAYGAADAYARHPASTCAKTVAAALRGDAAARRVLVAAGGTTCPD